jgi:phage terminase large subunit-like protein
MITVCGGASIDIDQVGDTVLEIAGMFDVVEIGVDRNRTGDLIRRVEAALGRPVILVNQTMTHISEPAKELERLVGAVELHHNNNGCLNWQVGCVKVRVNGDQIKPIKGHDQSSGKRIDAIYALVDAIYARMNGEAPAGSVYEERGMICL